MVVVVPSVATASVICPWNLLQLKVPGGQRPQLPEPGDQVKQWEAVADIQILGCQMNPVPCK